MKKQEKTFFVENLAAELKDAQCVILINFTGLSVKAQQELKKRLREVGAQMLVTKNTLFRLASQKAGLPQKVASDEVLVGQTALVIGNEDPVAPLSVIGKFAEEHEVPSLKVGLVEGVFQDKDNLLKLAQLPGKEALLSQMIGSLTAPMYGAVSVLNTKMQELVFVLQNAEGGDH